MTYTVSIGTLNSTIPPYHTIQSTISKVQTVITVDLH